MTAHRLPMAPLAALAMFACVSAPIPDAYFGEDASLDLDAGTKTPLSFDATPESEGKQAMAEYIVGGQLAQAGEYPWAVYAGGCGASLIGESWVLSAAHCYQSFQVGQWINIGGMNVNQMSNGNSGEWRQIASRNCHNQYNSWTSDYDYCIIKLATPSTMEPVEIDRTNSDHAGENAVVVGWGATSQNGWTSSDLREAIVPVMTQNQCNNMYGWGQITDQMLCAGYAQGGIDSCQGDSGGPLVSTVTGKQIGVVSWGAGCAQPNAPGVYAKVNKVDEWICNNTNQEALGCANNPGTDPSNPGNTPPTTPPSTPPTTPPNNTPPNNTPPSNPPTTPPPSTPTTPVCNVQVVQWLGDGYCDYGAYNTEECGYDGGDCCPATCNPTQFFCGSNGYQCEDPAMQGVCTAPRPDWIGDGFCDHDPAFNNEACGFDGGDCCFETCSSSVYPCGYSGYTCLDPLVY